MQKKETQKFLEESKLEDNKERLENYLKSRNLK